MKKSYMVYCDGPTGHKPKKKHESPALAIQEASRLIAKFPDRRFLVVEVIGSVEVKDGHVLATEAI